MLPIMVFIFLAIQLLVVAYVDFKTRKISNMWLLINGIFFLVLTFVYPQNYAWSFNVLLFPASFLIVGFGLFALHWNCTSNNKLQSSTLTFSRCTGNGNLTSNMLS